jgi:hypothetical protein
LELFCNNCFQTISLQANFYVMSLSLYKHGVVFGFSDQIWGNYRCRITSDPRFEVASMRGGCSGLWPQLTNGIEKLSPGYVVSPTLSYVENAHTVLTSPVWGLYVQHALFITETTNHSQNHLLQAVRDCSTRFHWFLFSLNISSSASDSQLKIYF